MGFLSHDGLVGESSMQLATAMKLMRALSPQMLVTSLAIEFKRPLSHKMVWQSHTTNPLATS